MIKRLRIRNYAIIESLEVEFADGLTIITGETGAGKSILLGALGLIMGERADTKALYDPEHKCVIEGFFSIQDYDMREFFERNDLDYEVELIVRREIIPSGKSRAFINDTPVNLAVLRDLTSVLVDLHQQFDTLDIHSVGFQLRLIDALANNQSLLVDYQRRFKEYSSKQRQLRELRERNASAAREMEFIEFQLTELHQANLVTGEQENLEQEQKRLTSAEDIKRFTASAFRQLSQEDMSVLDQLQEMSTQLGPLTGVDDRIADIHQRLQGVIVELEDASGELEKLAEDTEYDEARIQEVQERLDLLYRLQKKNTVSTVEELLAIQADLEARMEAFEDLEGSINRLTQEVTQLEQQLRQHASEMHQRRAAVAPAFAERVQDRLATLSMPAAQLRIDFRELEELSSTGSDEVEFLFSANRGSRLQAIRDVASGGELARLTLVTKSLVASAMALPTLIFDEIDAGVSGDVALKMGLILRELSDHHQVVVITHSPQVASRADMHYFIYKTEQDERTTTRVRNLTPDERVRAIATMLSQSPPSESALENARELMGK